MSARRSRPAGPVRALGYVRVSTAGQVDSGAGLDAQRAALEAEAARAGWTLEIVTDAGLSGATMRRPALTEALARLDRGDADVLVAAKLDRVSRSVKDFADELKITPEAVRSSLKKARRTLAAQAGSGTNDE